MTNGTNGRSARTPGRRLAALAAVALLGALCGWIAAPCGAAADSKCQSYCSGPHKDYNDCMEKCISSQEQYNPRRAERSIEDLCRSKGHDEEACLREHGFRGSPPPSSCYRDQWGRTVCERY